MTDAPFRFGLSVRAAESRAALREQARRAEALGYSTLLLADHLGLAAPLPALVSLAEACGLRVGTFVLNNDFRHPGLLAQEAATIDLLTDGRLELGLGAGHMASEYREIGLPFDRPGRRVERLAESVTIVKRLLAGEEVTFAGDHYELAGHRLSPLPAQAHVPLVIGGNGPRLLSLAAREADIVGFVGFTHRRGGTEFDFAAFSDAGTAERVALVRDAAGERFGALELNALVQRVEVTDRPDSVLAELSAEFALEPETLRSSPYLLIGSPEAMAETLLERRERLGISYWVVFEPYIEAFADVIARLPTASTGGGGS
jgi:probable F420-dependent oxidoreductase